MKSFWIFVFLLFFAALQIYSTLCSPGLTYDSSDYLQASEDFAQEKVMHNKNGSLYLERAPLYPVLLSFFGKNKIPIGNWINLLSLCLCLGIFLELGRKSILSFPMRFFYGMCLAFSTPLLLVGNFLWSEAVFMAFLALHFYFFYRYLDNGQSRFLWMMALMAFLCCLQRTSGLFYVFATMLIVPTQGNWTRFFKRNMLYGLTGMSGMLIWTFFIAPKGDTGYQLFSWPVFEEILKNLYWNLDTMSVWLLPGFLSVTFRVLIMAGLSMVLWLFWENLKSSLPESKQRFIRGMMINVLVYTFGIIVLFSLQDSARTAAEEIVRYQAVNFPMILLAALVSLDLSFRKINQKSTLRFIILIILVLWLVYPVARSLKNVHFWHRNQCPEQAKSTRSLTLYNYDLSTASILRDF